MMKDTVGHFSSPTSDRATQPPDCPTPFLSKAARRATKQQNRKMQKKNKEEKGKKKGKGERGRSGLSQLLLGSVSSDSRLWLYSQFFR